jgi:hypothetical protein
VCVLLSVSLINLRVIIISYVHALSLSHTHSHSQALNSYSQDHPKHTDLVNRFMGRTQVEELQRLALFKAVPLDELYLVQCLLGWHVLLPGEVLFREGSLCASLYIMVTGRCTAHAFGDGRESNEHEEVCMCVCMCVCLTCFPQS